MSSNRVSLAQFERMPGSDAIKLTTEDLSMLLEDYTELRARTEMLGIKLQDTMAARYGDTAQQLRQASGDGHSGRVRWVDGEYAIVSDAPKKVAYDQALLAKAVEQIRAQGEDPAEYVEVRYVVQENKWKAWPSKIQQIFLPARTVSTGKHSYSIKKDS